MSVSPRHNSSSKTPGSAEWLADGVAQLRGALRQHVQTPDGDGDRLFRAVISPIARKSRAQGVDAATTVVAFKQVWYGLPEVDMLSRRDSQDLLDKAVTVLIEEYYQRA